MSCGRTREVLDATKARVATTRKAKSDPLSEKDVRGLLKEVDEVAYVRFASVYRNFREAKDFEAFLGKLGDAT